MSTFPPALEPQRTLGHLRFRRDGMEIDIDFATGDDCRIALAALAEFMSPKAAPPIAAPTKHVVVAVPVSEAKPEPEPVAARPNPTEKGRCRGRLARLSTWIEKQPSMVSPAQMRDAFPGEFPSPAACSAWLMGVIARDDSPIERVGRGYYRAKRGGGAPAADRTQKGLAPPRRDCCDEQRREQHGRDTFSAGLREIVLPLALSNLKREASTAEAITRARHVYAGGPRPSP